MAFPTTLDTLSTTRGTTGQPLNNPNHITHHTAEDTAIQALEAKVGVDGSAVTTSHDYKLSGVATGDKAVSKTGTETLTNKTLTSPVINVGSDATGDIYYRNSGGLFTRLAIGSSSAILSVSASGIPEWISNPSAADASTTVKGVSEEATLAETLARTASGGTSARLFVNPTNLTTVQTYDYIASAVGTDAYAITTSPVVTAYVAGQVFRFKADVANTGAATLNICGLGAKSILRTDGSTLADGDIASGQIVEVVYDGTNMLMISPLANAPKMTHGTTTKDMTEASNTQTIAHGLGRIPRYIKITALTATVSAGSGLFKQSVGVYNGTTTSTVWFGTTNNQNDRGLSTTNVVYITTGNAESQVATATFDATNITLTWTKAGSPTQIIQILWEAIA